MTLGTAPAVVAAPAARPALDPITLRPCFGAASRDSVRPCSDPSLRLRIFPAPTDVSLEPNQPCEPSERTELLYPCRFGVRTAAAGAPPETVALVGDSHASHWRGAVELLAAAKRQPAVSIARSRCPFIDARVVLAPADAAGCRAWNRELKAYLSRHREITTLFIFARASADFVRARGKSNFETQVAGHIALWRALPATIRHIVVIRDTPRSSASSLLCVQRAFAARREAGRRCARSRTKALHADAALVAARRMRSARVHAIDLSRFFCDARLCFPVIGGAAVYKDFDHITAVYARTLGPYLLRAYDEILRAAPSAPGQPRGPLDDLLSDERAAAECLIFERVYAAAAGGFRNVPPQHLQRANACRAMLEPARRRARRAGSQRRAQPRQAPRADPRRARRLRPRWRHAPAARAAGARRQVDPSRSTRCGGGCQRRRIDRVILIGDRAPVGSVASSV